MAYPGTAIVLGSNPTLQPHLQRGYHHLSAPNIGEPNLTLDDSDRPRSDGIIFGQDFRGGRLITFELGLRGNDDDDVLTLSGDLLSAWRGDAVRNTPGEVATLCTSRSGLLRQCYGRPRRCSTEHTKPRSAFMVATADFQTIDDLWYDPAVNSTNVGLIPPASGGFTAPFTAPITVLSNTSQFGGISVGGTIRTWPVITIRGPITNPIIELVGEWIMSMSIVIAAGSSITLDTRPWARTVLNQSGGSVAGALNRSTRLDRMALDPGDHTASFRGTDLTGTANMTIAWNNAYVSI